MPIGGTLVSEKPIMPILLNLILNGKIEFMLTPRLGWLIWVFEKDVLSITFVKTGALSLIIIDAINL